MALRVLTALMFLSLSTFAQYSCKQGKMLRHFTKSSAVDNMRSDTLDILNYHIDLEVTNFSGRTISGFCAIRFTPKMDNISNMNLDLLGLKVDSVLQNGNKIDFSYASPLLQIQLDQPYSLGDTSTVEVYYNGQVYPEAAGFGGFHFSGGYAYSIGVGFQTSPHNYGRSWFPCFDNFVERSTYTFDIKTLQGMVATANGVLVDRSPSAGGLTSNKWEMKDEIPTYLACIAVADYKTLSSVHQGVDKDILIELYAAAADTNSVKSGFAQLGSAIDAYEQAFGPYQWDKVGYSMVPLGGGAMEHATNIAYPIAGIGSETLMAHELAHSWWGNLATCHQAEEMWINEGMATYCEALFLEHTYGREAYEEEIDIIHREVVRFPHHFEETYWALDSVPERYTYGSHVYRKGADVAHTLRGYLGDELFFSGLTEFLEDHRFDDVSSAEMMTELSAITGVDLSDFFQNWVMSPGFAQFETRSFTSMPTAGNYDVSVVLGQKIKGAPALYNNVPLTISFMDSQWNMHHESVVMSGKEQSFDFSLPIDPVYVTVDFDNLISDAVTDDKLKITGNFFRQLANSNLSLSVRNVVDSAFLRIEHMWVAPDTNKASNNPYQLSTSRYIRIDGIIPESFDATMRMSYDARQTTGGDFGWLDHDLMSESMDTLRLFYRSSTSEDWEEYPYYRTGIIGPQRAFGTLLVDSVLKGEYTLGKRKSTSTGIKEEKLLGEDFSIYPNPNAGSFQIALESKASRPREYRIYDVQGKMMHRGEIPTGVTQHLVGTALKAGIYLVSVEGSQTKKLLVE